MNMPHLQKQINPCLPILIIGHRRADELAQVLDQVRKISPSQLFLAMDGPRTIEEESLTNAARSIAVEAINWDCEVRQLFSSKNLGCRKFMLEAISWFFGNVDAGIVIEDDILIHTDFPEFASRVLAKPGVGIVSACTHSEILDPDFYEPAFFSRIPSIWGWACTSNVWKSFLSQQENRPSELHRMVFQLNTRVGIWQSLLFGLCLKLVDRGKLQTWDYEFAYFLISHKLIAVYPQRSMASNIGNSNLATHTSTSTELTSPLTEGSLNLGDFTFESLHLNKAYMARQALNTPFLPEYRIHVVKGLLAYALDKLGIREKMGF
jgi:hypothetical protein